MTGTTRSIVKSGGMNGRSSRTAIWKPMTARSVWTCVPMPDRGLILSLLSMRGLLSGRWKSGVYGTLTGTCHFQSENTLYNKDFTERDGGILETDGDKPVQEAMTELLAEFGCDVAQGRVMDAAELREQADMVAEQQAEVLKEKLAAERPAPEETLSFYVAECLEFTFAGEFHDHLTMEEALEAYDKIPSERMNADKCIGFCIEEDGGFVGMYELVVNDKVQRENINSINYFRDDKLVQQAISDMEKLMAARQQNKEQERSSTKKSVLDALHSLKAKKQEQPAQEQDKPKKAKTKGMEL